LREIAYIYPITKTIGAMSKKISIKEVRTAAAKVSAEEFMAEYGESAQLEIYDADNILNYNEGVVNLKFSGGGKTDLFITFIDGVCEVVERYDNVG